MNASRNHYLFGGLFFAIGVYQLIVGDWSEFWLYAAAGSAFVVTALSGEPRLQRHRKPLAIISWLLILGTGILFLFMLQFRYL